MLRTPRGLFSTSVSRAVTKIRTQKNIKVDYESVEDADHFYRTPGDKTSDHLPAVEQKVSTYLDMRLAMPPTPAPAPRR